jgi:hypothetical protein
VWATGALDGTAHRAAGAVGVGRRGGAFRSRAVRSLAEAGAHRREAGLDVDVGALAL